MDQNEIDALLGGSPEPDDEGAAQGGNAPQKDGEETDAGELTQADIDAALAGTGGPEGDAAGAGSPDEGSLSAEGGVSQADVDALIGGAASASSDSTEAEAGAAPLGLDSEGRPLDELGAAMAAALAEEKAAAEEAGQTSSPAEGPAPEELKLPEFGRAELASEVNQPITLLHDVELHVKIELGRTHMFVEDVLRLVEGSVVELDRLAGDPVDVFVNERLVARGEVLVLNDNFCVRVSEIVSQGGARLAG